MVSNVIKNVLLNNKTTKTTLTERPPHRSDPDLKMTHESDTIYRSGFQENSVG